MNHTFWFGWPALLFAVVNTILATYYQLRYSGQKTYMGIPRVPFSVSMLIISLVFFGIAHFSWFTEVALFLSSAWFALYMYNRFKFHDQTVYRDIPLSNYFFYMGVNSFILFFVTSTSIILLK